LEYYDDMICVAKTHCINSWIYWVSLWEKGCTLFDNTAHHKPSGTCDKKTENCHH